MTKYDKKMRQIWPVPTVSKGDLMKNKQSKYDQIGINKNTYEILFNDYDNISANKKSLENSYIITMIEHYTRFREKSIFRKLLKIFFENYYKLDFSKIKFNEETHDYEYEFNGEIYNFNKISRLIENKKVIKELESKRRYGQCHEKSLEQSLTLSKADIVTGYIKRFQGKYLHSVVETSIGKEIYIIDYTKNIIMTKE